MPKYIATFDVTVEDPTDPDLKGEELDAAVDQAASTALGGMDLDGCTVLGSKVRVRRADAAPDPEGLARFAERVNMLHRLLDGSLHTRKLITTAMMEIIVSMEEEIGD